MNSHEEYESATDPESKIKQTPIPQAPAMPGPNADYEIPVATVIEYNFKNWSLPLFIILLIGFGAYFWQFTPLLTANLLSPPRVVTKTVTVEKIKKVYIKGKTSRREVNRLKARVKHLKGAHSWTNKLLAREKRQHNILKENMATAKERIRRLMPRRSLSERMRVRRRR